jgi:hypothetical protein
MFANAIFCLAQRGIMIIFGIKNCKIFLAEGSLQCREHEEMAGYNSAKKLG